MNKPIMKLLSLVLVLALLIGMLPAEAMAAAFENTQATVSTEALSAKEAVVVAEDTAKRTEYTKQFRMSNGMYIAAVYPEPVHFEEDGAWVDIDNTLKLSRGAYTNTAGIWEVSLPQQLSGDSRITVTRNGHTLSFGMAGELHKSGDHELMSASAVGRAAETVQIQVNGVAETYVVTGAKTSAAQLREVTPEAGDDTPEEMRLDKLSSRLQYGEVYANTDILYDLQSSKVKESVVMERYSSTLRGYRYYLETGEMIPVLNEAGQILFLDPENKETVMAMEAPFLVDSSLEFSYDIDVQIQPNGSGYILTYLLPRDWLADSSRVWPVTLDPVVTPELSLNNIDDQTVMSKKEKEHTWGMIQAGYYSTEGITRFYLKYNDLPALTSSDVIVGATLKLHKLESSTSYAQVQVHKVKTTWESSKIHWSNKPDFDEMIVDSLNVRWSGDYYWNVTDIVREWYIGENTGMMFKCPDSVENAGVNNFKQFFSSNWGVDRPSLSIWYLNCSGVESYWDYTTHSAGRAGEGHINSFTGNLVWTNNDIGFGGNRMPVTVSRVYNANDIYVEKGVVKSRYDFGLGYGWRTNFHQRVGPMEGNSDYLFWEDADGTTHYFKEKTTGTYEAEYVYDLTLKNTGSGAETYELINKQGEITYFDAQGRLTKIQNNQKVKSSITVTYDGDSNRITSVTDGAGRVYSFEYNSGDMLESIIFMGTGTSELSKVEYTYTGYDLSTVKYKDGKSAAYTYTNHLLTEAADIDGYKLTYAYSEVQDAIRQPRRVVQVQETYNGTEGGLLKIEYAQNQTTFTDHNDHVQIVQFNDLGNVTSIQDGLGRAQHAEYVLSDVDQIASAPTSQVAALMKTANQMLKSSKLQNTVVNLLTDSGFESGTLWTASNANASQSLSSTAYVGQKSLSVTATAANTGVKKSFTAAAKESYTFSAYVKTGSSGAARLAFYSGSTQLQTSEVLPANSDWTRLQVTYTNEGTAAQNVTAQLVLDAAGTVYMDCVQLENAASASRYNLVENGDFREAGIWTYTDGTRVALPQDDTVNKVFYRNGQPPQLDDNVCKFTTSLTDTNRISQTIKISGIKGDSYVLAGWARGDSAPLGSVEDRRFSVLATFMKGTTVVNTGQVDFNPDADSKVSWQYAAEPMVADGTYDSIKIEVAYDYNANTAYFDGIQLFKEEYGESYEYDAETGEVTSVTDLQKQRTEYKYDDKGNLTQILQDNKAKMTYVYDLYNNVTKATSEEGLVYSFVYDDFGNNTKVSITSGGVTLSSEAVYSTDGNRLISTKDALDNTTTYSYNPQTNVLESVQYPNGASTSTVYSYDSMYRMLSAAAGTGVGNQTLTANYTYTNDLLTKIVTGSTTYNFTYGSFGLLHQIKVGSQALATYAYTNLKDKNLQKLTYGNGDYVSYLYDEYSRVTKETYEDGKYVAYRYDNDGFLASVQDSETGRITSYSYDLSGRLAKYREKDSSLDHSVAYRYDQKNNLSKQTEKIGSATYTTDYSYDEDNRIENLTSDLGTADTADDLTMVYSYDDFGRLDKQELKKSTAANAGTATAFLSRDYTYKGSTDGTKTTGQVAELEITTPGYNITFGYTYDANGNIKTASVGSRTTTYTYDSQNQLIREDNQAAGKSWTWSYDNAGNIQSKSEYAYTTGTLGSVQSTISYGYTDANWKDKLTSYGGNQISYDLSGNMLSDGTWTYTWKHGRELASMSGNGTAWSFTYGADGMRTKREGSMGKTYNYVYNGSQLTRMTVAGNTLTFTYDAAGTPVSVKLNNTVYYYETNLQGDVTAIVDGNGEIVAYYNYDAWGKDLSEEDSNSVIVVNTIGTLNPLRYRGYVYDTETGLYYLQTRYYDPEVGRFINSDILVSTGQGLLGNNMFAYCLNNPTNYSDPSGLCGLCLANRVSDQFSMTGVCEGGNGSGGGTGSGGVAVPITPELAKEIANIIVATVATLEATTQKRTQHVYILTDPDADDMVKYVGRTNDPARRMTEHKHDPKHPERQNYEMQVLLSGLTLREAMLFEQVLISAFTLDHLDNARREIAVGNINSYQQHLAAVMEIFVGCTEDGLLALLGG